MLLISFPVLTLLFIRKHHILIVLMTITLVAFISIIKSFHSIPVLEKHILLKFPIVPFPAIFTMFITVLSDWLLLPTFVSQVTFVVYTYTIHIRYICILDSSLIIKTQVSVAS